MARWKYIFRNLWDLIRLGRFKTNREKLDDLARSLGYDGIEVTPKKKKYKTGRPFKKVPKVYEQ